MRSSLRRTLPAVVRTSSLVTAASYSLISALATKQSVVAYSEKRAHTLLAHVRPYSQTASRIEGTIAGRGGQERGDLSGAARQAGSEPAPALRRGLRQARGGRRR